MNLFLSQSLEEESVDPDFCLKHRLGHHLTSLSLCVSLSDNYIGDQAGERLIQTLANCTELEVLQ